jgi:hypothetical protein
MLMGVFAIISGISGHGILFNIAVSGPLLWFSLGIFIIFFVIESRHGISQSIDSKVTKIQGLETSNKEISLKLELVMILSSIIMALESIYFLSGRLYSAFVICLSFSSILLATVIGRKFGSSVGESERRDSWEHLDKNSKMKEYKQLKDWLKGDLSETLSTAQEEKINLQKDIFVMKIKSGLTDYEKSKKTIKDLSNSKDEVELVKILFSVTMKKSYSEWLIGAIDFSTKRKEYAVKNALEALLLLPPVIELMAHISAPGGGGNAKLFNRLLTVSAQFAKRLHSFDLLLDGGQSIPNSTEGNNRHIDANIQEFIKFISLKASMNDEYEFTPWWLINIRSMMEAIPDLDSWDYDKSVPGMLSVLVPEVSKEKENWCFLLSEFFDGTEYVDESYDVSKLFAYIFNLQTGDYVTDLLKLTWYSYQKLK